jgi:hypothetical protein
MGWVRDGAMFCVCGSSCSRKCRVVLVINIAEGLGVVCCRFSFNFGVE